MWLQTRMFLLIAVMFGILYGVIVGIGTWMGAGSAVIYIILAFAFLGLQYLIGPAMVGWAMRIKWVSDKEEPELHRMVAELAQKAARLADELNAIGGSRIDIDQVELSSKAGGGALPLLELPSRCLRIKIQGLSANKLELNMRRHTPPIIGRIENDAWVIDPRTLLDDDLPIIRSAFEKLLK